MLQTKFEKVSDMLATKSIVALAIFFIIVPNSYADKYGIDEQINERYLEESQASCEDDPSCMKYENMLYRQELQAKIKRESEEDRLKQDDPIGYFFLFLKRLFILIVGFFCVLGFYGLLFKLFFGKKDSDK